MARSGTGNGGHVMCFRVHQVEAGSDRAGGSWRQRSERHCGARGPWIRVDRPVQLTSMWTGSAHGTCLLVALAVAVVPLELPAPSRPRTRATRRGATGRGPDIGASESQRPCRRVNARHAHSRGRHLSSALHVKARQDGKAPRIDSLLLVAGVRTRTLAESGRRTAGRCSCNHERPVRPSSRPDPPVPRADSSGGRHAAHRQAHDSRQVP
jgi:hypothetical protein